VSNTLVLKGSEVQGFWVQRLKVKCEKLNGFGGSGFRVQRSPVKFAALVFSEEFNGASRG